MIPQAKKTENAMRTAFAILTLLTAAPVLAKLPPLSEEAKAQAAESAAKTAWSDKVGQYQTCKAQDRAVEAYRKNAQISGTAIPVPVSTQACADPGPYVSAITPAANKPLEASEAHSPPGAAISPPSTKATAAEIAGGIKKGSPN
jgi:hypothetical protein